MKVEVGVPAAVGEGEFVGAGVLVEVFCGAEMDVGKTGTAVSVLDTAVERRSMFGVTVTIVEGKLQADNKNMDKSGINNNGFRLNLIYSFSFSLDKKGGCGMEISQSIDSL